MSSDFIVTAGCGSFRTSARADVEFQHRWTDQGVSVELQFTGAHLLHLSVAGCVLNDLYREADPLGIELKGVRVTVDGDFDRNTWRSTGITYRVEVDSDASKSELDDLIGLVDGVAEIPMALRLGAIVERVQ
jgi:uncharacterized OsmC-like protein